MSIESNKTEFINLFKSNVSRDGVTEFLDYLERETDFYTAPASTFLPPKSSSILMTSFPRPSTPKIYTFCSCFIIILFVVIKFHRTILDNPLVQSRFNFDVVASVVLYQN